MGLAHGSVEALLKLLLRLLVVLVELSIDLLFCNLEGSQLNGRGRELLLGHLLNLSSFSCRPRSLFLGQGHKPPRLNSILLCEFPFSGLPGSAGREVLIGSQGPLQVLASLGQLLLQPRNVLGVPVTAFDPMLNKNNGPAHELQATLQQVHGGDRSDRLPPRRSRAEVDGRWPPAGGPDACSARRGERELASTISRRGGDVGKEQGERVVVAILPPSLVLFLDLREGSAESLSAPGAAEAFAGRTSMLRRPFQSAALFRYSSRTLASAGFS